MPDTETSAKNTSDQLGSIFLPEQRFDMAEVTVKQADESIESLCNRFLSLDWEKAEECLNTLEAMYPTLMPKIYSNLENTILLRRGNMRERKDVPEFIMQEIRKFLLELIMSRRSMGAIAVRTFV